MIETSVASWVPGDRPRKIRILGVPLDLGRERRGVEINPIIDLMNKTAILGVGLVSSALGKKIL